MRISDWSSDVCSSDRIQDLVHELLAEREAERSEEVTVLVEHLYRLLDLSMRQVAIKEALSCIREIAKLRGLYPPRRRRSEERRVGKECVSPCRSRWSPCH